MPFNIPSDEIGNWKLAGTPNFEFQKTLTAEAQRAQRNIIVPKCHHKCSVDINWDID